MNDEHADGAAARGLFVFVGPAAVVGEGFALEELLVVGRRLVDDDQCDLALQVDLFAVRAGVVVPVVLRRVNAVAHKDDGRIDVRGRLPGLVL